VHPMTQAWGALARTSTLSLADRISVAEQALERGNLAGKTIDVPDGHVDDPAYQAAIAPLTAWVREITGQQWLRIRYSAYDLMVAGNPLALTDGMNYIVVRKQTNEMTILHECAHVLADTPEGPAGHSMEFAEIARDLYAKYISPEAGRVFWRNIEVPPWTPSAGEP